MKDQEKLPSQPTIETGKVDESPAEKSPEHLDRFKETTDKIWDSTRHAWSTATFKANQYKKLVQKKIDLSAMHKKINASHADLGKLVDDLREAGQENIMETFEVRAVLTRLDDLKTAAAALEEEVEKIRVEEPPQEVAQSEGKPE